MERSGPELTLHLWKIATISVYLLFLAAVTVVCFKRPVAGDFDRYIYEALVRGRHQSVEVIYPIVKHSNPRAEGSTVLDSPEHLAQLEPLYAIRPFYVDAIAIAARTGFPIQQAISLVSALSLFGIGLVLLGWTRQPVACALVMATPAIAGLGRIGTPDALSSLVLLAAVWAIVKDRLSIGVFLLLLSIWVRTDNVLVALTVILWLAWSSKLSIPHAAVLAGAAVASVLIINHLAGNYGWSVLFRFSFIGGPYPAQVSPHVSWREYMAVVGRGLVEVGGEQLALWTLVGFAAWRWLPPASIARNLLIPIAAAALARFLLFPTPQDRYFAWAYLIVGAAFIEAITQHYRGSLPARTMERSS